jgi:hypothetical protein
MRCLRGKGRRLDQTTWCPPRAEEIFPLCRQIERRPRTMRRKTSEIWLGGLEREPGVRWERLSRPHLKRWD